MHNESSESLAVSQTEEERRNSVRMGVLRGRGRVSDPTPYDPIGFVSKAHRDLVSFMA